MPKNEWVVTLRAPMVFPDGAELIVVLPCWQLPDGSKWRGKGHGVALHGPTDMPRQERSLGVDCRRPYTVSLKRLRDDQWYGPITKRKMLEIDMGIFGDGEGGGSLQSGIYGHLPGI